jgi:hypothetical protein
VEKVLKGSTERDCSSAPSEPVVPVLHRSSLETFSDTLADSSLEKNRCDDLNPLNSSRYNFYNFHALKKDGESIEKKK